jgi:ParB family chromosome partitioning protein
MWDLHDRLEEQVNEKTCRHEIASVAAYGQIVPVLGRRVTSDPQYDFELIYGSRRLFVTRHLNIPLLLEVRDLSDRESLLAMDIENRQRRDLSPYERGRSYASWLRAGLFESQEVLARVLRISPSQLSRLIKLAQLPSVLVNAFPSPLDICETWGGDLMDAWSDENRKRLIVSRAREIARVLPRPSAVHVFQHLVSGSDRAHRSSRRKSRNLHDEVVKDEQGAPLFRVQVRRKGVAVMLPSQKMSGATLELIKSEISRILQRETSQTIDLAAHSGRSPISKPELKLAHATHRRSAPSADNSENTLSDALPVGEDRRRATAQHTPLGGQ